MMELTDIQWAYLAGIFDGEGSVHLRKAYNRFGALRTYSLTVTVVCGTHLSSIEEMGKMVGKDHMEMINGYGNKRYAGRIRLHSKEALEFLLGIRQYVIIKKEQVELAITFQSTKVGKGKRVDDSRVEFEMNSKIKLTALNLRGVAHA